MILENMIFENMIFEQAETLTSNLSEGKKLEDVATELNYKS